MGNFAKTYRLTKRRRIFQDLTYAPIISPQEYLKHETCKQLRLCELLWTETMRIIRKHAHANLMRVLHYLYWRFAHSAHLPVYAIFSIV